MKILVINSGSSSIKYKLFNMESGSVLAAGLVERIGEENGRIQYNSFTQKLPIPTHQAGLQEIIRLLLDEQVGVIASPNEIVAVGHRVVHGGEKFSQPTPITRDVIATIEQLSPLAPLHNPANLAGIQVAQEMFPHAMQVAVFDTAFHQTLPPHAFRYALPNSLYEQDGVRVYGFHGTSHLYVAKVAATYLSKPPEEANVITAHLGNGASITAVSGGQSVDTSMGFTPLPGLIMGTRSGDIDPAIIFYLVHNKGMSITEIDTLLNKKSGLVGICGQNDWRDIQQRVATGDEAAKLALAMYTYRIKKYVGSYTAVLGQVDALIFTAGVGENSPLVRQMACAGLEKLGYILDNDKNKATITHTVTEIQTTASPHKILIIPTNEELEIAQQTLSTLARRNDQA